MTRNAIKNQIDGATAQPTAIEAPPVAFLPTPATMSSARAVSQYRHESRKDEDD
jgi:hypothetical protein